MRVVDVATPSGPGRIAIAASDDPKALLLLGHGAGGGIDAFDLQALAARLPSLGIVVLRFEQPWVVAGRRLAGRPASLDAAWADALAYAQAAFPGLPLFVGGRSAGARVACRCFAPPALGAVCLAFPLHPPGKPRTSRVHELVGVDGPVLVIQGTSDPFGTGDDLRDALRGTLAQGRVAIVDAPGAHSVTPRSKAARAGADDLANLIATHVDEFVADRLAAEATARPR